MRLVPYIALIAVIAAGCQNKPDSRSKAAPRSEAELIEMNKSMITRDRSTIADYLGKSERKFTETNTGLECAVPCGCVAAAAHGLRPARSGPRRPGPSQRRTG